MRRLTPSIVAKALVILVAGAWHAWLVMPASPAGILIGLLPYYLLILAWDFLGLILVAPVLLAISWLAVDAGMGFRHSISSTGGVALGVQALLACGVVGAAVIVRLLIPAKRGKRSGGSSL